MIDRFAALSRQRGHDDIVSLCNPPGVDRRLRLPSRFSCGIAARLVRSEPRREATTRFVKQNVVRFVVEMRASRRNAADLGGWVHGMHTT